MQKRMPAKIDLAPITRHMRAMYSSRLLIASVCHLNVFEHFENGPQTLDGLQACLGLADRPTKVLVPALCAMGMLSRDIQGRYLPTEVGSYLVAGHKPNMISYLSLESEDPGVMDMVQRLLSDGPLQDPEQGFAYVKEGDTLSPMDDPESARFLTLALSHRAQYLSSLVAAAMPSSEGRLLDIGCGSGFFSFEWLLNNPNAIATLVDSAAVLSVAQEVLEQYCRSGRAGSEDIKDRVTLLPGDMWTVSLPQADIVLAASVFHDWDSDSCERLAMRLADALAPGGELWVHDAFLNDTLDGPLPVTDYSAQLFWVTKGRAYSRQECYGWLAQAGLEATDVRIPTLLEYGLLSARKPKPSRS